MPDSAIDATVSLNGLELFYELRGSGPPLLLLHGGTGCHADWAYAGRDDLAAEYQLMAPDARGHGRSTNSQPTITHRQCALDTLALLDHLGIDRCRAIGVSMGGNILLHMATLQPDRITAMVVVSAAMYFPQQARSIMAQVQVENRPPSDWEAMRKRHHLGDEQILALWEWGRSLKDSHDDMNFTPLMLSTIRASTLIVTAIAIRSIPSRWPLRCTAPSPSHPCGSCPTAATAPSSLTPPPISRAPRSAFCGAPNEKVEAARCNAS